MASPTSQKVWREKGLFRTLHSVNPNFTVEQADRGALKDVAREEIAILEDVGLTAFLSQPAPAQWRSV